MSVSVPRDLAAMGRIRRALVRWWRSRPAWQAAEQAAAIEAARWLRGVVTDYRHPYGGGR